MSKTIKKYCAPFIFFIPAKYEQWLEQMALQGWHPVNIGHFSSLAMRFEQTQPKQYRYVVDLQAIPKPDYVTIYKDFGWELAGRMSSIFIWRKEYTNTESRPESFTDTESRRNRNNRFLLIFFLLFILFTVSVLAITVTYAVTFSWLNAEQHAEFAIGLLIACICAVLTGIISQKLYTCRDV